MGLVGATIFFVGSFIHLDAVAADAIAEICCEMGERRNECWMRLHVCIEYRSREYGRNLMRRWETNKTVVDEAGWCG